MTNRMIMWARDYDNQFAFDSIIHWNGECINVVVAKCRLMITATCFSRKTLDQQEELFHSNRIASHDYSLFKASFDEAILIEERIVVAKELHERVHDQLGDSFATLFTILSDNLNGLVVIFFSHLSLNFF